jgi:tRNA A37 threonylcarbamoyladenosine biosynthesis protein TsaE
MFRTQISDNHFNFTTIQKYGFQKFSVYFYDLYQLAIGSNC